MCGASKGKLTNSLFRKAVVGKVPALSLGKESGLKPGHTGEKKHAIQLNEEQVCLIEWMCLGVRMMHGMADKFIAVCQ